MFHPLPADDLSPPPRFTYPHYYLPHPLARRAAKDLQQRIADRYDLTERGKMFGVLVVRHPNGKDIGYLAAFSGKLTESNHHPGFVPPVFDLLQADGFYKCTEAELNALTSRIRSIENSPELTNARETLTDAKQDAIKLIEGQRTAMRKAKRRRDMQRAEWANLDGQRQKILNQELRAESISQHLALKDLRRSLRARTDRLAREVERIERQLTLLRDERAAKSADLQREIFAHYRFLNGHNQTADLNDLFAFTAFGRPPAGAGECAAPKLLQYAYRHRYYPLCMAEFWWGAAPTSHLRRHGHFYPACRGKCEPILAHMLQGLAVDPNPLDAPPDPTLTYRTVYEDDHLVVVSKPSGMLSVPGRRHRDSVLSRLQQHYPQATGPLLVHRLDMDTSGLLVAGKTKEAHRALQLQFQERTITKRYLARLSAPPPARRGTVELALRGDVLDRPRQLVDAEQGKPASSRYQLLRVEEDGTALVHLWPLTGRTHQLRVHAAHPHGLDAPIVGDDLYGQPSVYDRLRLHAEYIALQHPTTRTQLEFSDLVNL